MTADRGKAQRRKYEIDVGQWPSADQRQRAPSQLVETSKSMPQLRGYPDLLWRWRDIENSAVDVEQDRTFTQVTNERGFHKLHVAPGGF